MIPDKPTNAVIIPLLATVLCLPVWAYADSKPTGNEDQPVMTTDVMQGKTPESREEQAVMETATTTTPPLPHINSLESSPESSPGTMQFIPLNHLFFDHDKATLDQRSKSILDDAAQYVLLSNNVKRIIIHGHTDSVADKDYNDRVSDRRTNAVKNYLLKKKIPSELMWITGWGENDPIDENWTRVGSQRNRRVEIYLVQQTLVK